MLDGLEHVSTSPAAPWAPLARIAPPSTSSRASSRTPLPSPASRAQEVVPGAAPSTPRLPRLRSTTRKGEVTVSVDEGPAKARLDRSPASSPPSGRTAPSPQRQFQHQRRRVAAMVLMRASTAQRLAAKPLARIVGHATHAQAPEWFTHRPGGCDREAAEEIGWLAGGRRGSVGDQRGLRRRPWPRWRI